MKRLSYLVLLVVILFIAVLPVSALELSHTTDYYSSIGASSVVRAAYDENGKFLSCQMDDVSTLQNSNWTVDGSATYKEFVLTETACPYPAHNLVLHDAKAATCTAVGWESYTCSHCDYATNVEIPALGHDYVHHDAQAVTCTVIGWDAYDTCSRCDYTTYVEIPAQGHDYVVSVTEPTCMEQGYTTHTCSCCDDSYTDTYVAIVDHSYSGPIYVWDFDEGAYCTSSIPCKFCNVSSATETVLATVESTTPGTCTEPGKQVYVAVFTNPLFEEQHYEQPIYVSHSLTYVVKNEWQIERRCSECGALIETLTYPEYTGITYNAFDSLSTNDKFAIKQKMGTAVYGAWVLYLQDHQTVTEYGD